VQPPDNPLSVAELTTLAEIARAAQGTLPITFAEDDGRVSVGRARAFVRNEHGSYLQAHDDVRDAYLWVTMRSGFERFLPVGELVLDVREGKVALDYDSEARS
jgi:hypothetical protein